jgi:hypothetical protein
MPLDSHRLRFLLVAILAFPVVVAADYAIRGPKAKKRQARIEQDLRSILHPGSSNLIKAGSGFKTSGGHATKILQTDLAANEIESYYRARLENNGSFFIRKT